MYPPLQFIEQVSDYFHVQGMPKEEELAFNANVIRFLESEFCFDSQDTDLFVKDYVLQSTRIEKIGKYPRKIVDKYTSVEKELAYLMGIPWTESPYDTVNYFMQALVMNTWKYNKIAYKLSSALGEQLLDMEQDPVCSLHSISKLPAKTIYIDTSEFGSLIGDDIIGYFTIVSEVADEDGHWLYVCFITLVRGIIGRVLPIFTKFRTDISGVREDIKVVLDSNNSMAVVHNMEDGVTRKINEVALLKLFINTITYMQASNRDVMECSGCRRAFKKSGSRKDKGSVSNKFSDVKQYKVGYHIVRPRRYMVSSRDINTMGKGSKKSPHFRSAHWSHYWVGSGDNKHLELRWIGGIYVGEKDSNSDVAIHVVE